MDLRRTCIVIALIGASGVSILAPVHAQRPLAVTHVAVVDGSADTARTDQTVVVVGARIVAVGPATLVKPPTGARVIDARGNVVKEIGWRQAGAINAVLPPAANSATVFARLGNAIPLVLGLLLIAGGIVLGRRRR